MSAEVIEDLELADIGPYRLATRIAAGATADVFRALRRQSAGADRAVVIKRLLPSLAANAEAKAMFEHEAKLGLRVRHRNVVEVLDYDHDGKCPYLVLEYVFGVDLRRLAKWLTRERRVLPLPLAAWIASQMLAGLHAMHTAVDDRGAPLGIVHRDVSPSNVFISVHGDVKLGDLGIARALGGGGRAELTRGLGARSTAAKGKLGYLAPEQVNGGAADTRSDVFAGATIAAELLTGVPLFGRGSELDMLLAIRDARCDSLLDRATSWPPKLLDALLSALARSPDKRTQTAEELRRALASFVNASDGELHAQLGAEVVGALDAAPDTGDRTSLARTVEADTGRIAIIAEKGPPVRKERETMRPGVGALYSVKSQKGALGPWPYARVVQALHTGEVEPSSLVSIDGGAEKPLAAHSELATHVPPSKRISTLPPPRPKPSKLGRTGESWDLRELGLGSVLAQLLVDGETGLLVCEHDSTRKEIFLDHGAPVFVTSNRLGEMLGEHLVEAGVLDRTELDIALAAMPRFHGRLGDTLIALGLIEPLELFGHIAKQEREKLLDVFTWQAGRAALYRQAERPARGFPIHIDAWDLLAVGVLRRIAVGRETVSPRDVLMRSPTWESTGIALPVRLQVLLDSLAAPRTFAEIASNDADRADAVVLTLVGAAQVHSLPPRTP